MKQKDIKDVYLTYKVRNQIELLIDTIKNTLEYDTSYMSDNIHLEGWNLINQITLMLAYRIYSLLNNTFIKSKTLQDVKLEQYYSLEDVLRLCKKKKKIKYIHSIDTTPWVTQATPKETEDLLEKLLNTASIMYKPMGVN
jgi:hypothetical protein